MAARVIIDDNLPVGLWLRHRRLEKRLTAAEVGERLDVSINHIANLERGIRGRGVIERIRQYLEWADILGLSREEAVARLVRDAETPQSELNPNEADIWHD